MEAQTEQPELLTVEETARALRLGKTATNAFIWDGSLPSLKIGRRRLVRRDDLERFLDEHRDTPGE